MNCLFLVVIVVGIIYIIVQMKEEEEEYFALKIIGYYLLATFRFSFNNLHIPLGFIIYLIFFRNPPHNKKAKKAVSILGIVIFVINLMILYS